MGERQYWIMKESFLGGFHLCAVSNIHSFEILGHYNPRKRISFPPYPTLPTLKDRHYYVTIIFPRLDEESIIEVGTER